jgi:predicted transcriptional regulator
MKIVLKDHYIILKNLLEYKDFKLYKINHEVKVAFTVTDSLISLGLFGLDGVYDMVEDLICTGKKAQEWGMELFNYYLDKSTRVLQI